MCTYVPVTQRENRLRELNVWSCDSWGGGGVDSMSFLLIPLLTMFIRERFSELKCSTDDTVKFSVPFYFVVRYIQCVVKK